MAGSFRERPGPLSPARSLEKEKLFTALLEKSWEGIALLTSDGVLTYCGPSTHRVLGYPDEEILGRSVFEIVYPEDTPALRECQTQLLRAPGASCRIEARYLHHNGSWRWPESFATNLLHEPGVGAIISNFRDVTERKLWEQELRSSEHRYRLLFERNLAGVCLTTLPGRILDSNEAFARMLGYTRKELLGTEVEHLYINPAERQKLIRAMTTAGQLADVQLIFRKKDGEIIWAIANANWLPDKEHPQLIQATLVEITKRKRAEEQLRQLSTTLLRMQEEEQRRIARDLHDSTSQALTALILNLGFLKRSAGNLNDDHQKTVDECLELAKQCTNEVRTFSYLLHPPLLDEFGLWDALREYVNKFSLRSGIDVFVEIAPALIGSRLPYDLEITLFRIVQEALANVRYHSHSPRAHIRLHPHEDKMILEIVDSGCGIPEQVLNNLARNNFAQLGVGILGMRERI